MSVLVGKRVAPTPDHYNKLHAASIRQQFLQSLTSNVKSLAINNFMRVLTISVQRRLDFNYGFNVGGGLAKLVASFVMGRKGDIVKGNEEELLEEEEVEEEIEEEADSSKAFTDILRKRMKNASRGDKEVINSIIQNFQGDDCLERLRKSYLPKYLVPLVDCWRTKLSTHSYQNIGFAWRLFTDVNNVEFVQHLFPTPSLGGHYTKITSTLLAAIFTLYIKESNKLLPQDVHDLVPETLAKLPIKLEKWTPHPELLWRLVFPGIDSFVESQARRNHRLSFLHYAVMDSIFLKPMFAKLNTWTSRVKGFNSRSWRCYRDEEEKVCFFLL